MKIMIIVSALFFSLYSFTQTNHIAKGEELVEIKMPKFPIADLPKKSVKVSNIQVLQFVRDSVRLGYILKGLSNQVMQMVPSKPLTSMLQEQIEKMFGDDYKNDGIKLLLIIKDLRIGEKSSFKEFSFLKFIVNTYSSIDGITFEKTQMLDTVFVKESGGDVTAWHGEDVQNALKYVIKKAVMDVTNKLPQNQARHTIDEIKLLEKQQFNFPILNAKEYNEGGYTTFLEFLNNKPNIQNVELITIDKKKIKIIAKVDNLKPDTLSPWGICKKGKIFKYDDGLLIPIEKYGNGFIVSNYVEITNRKNSNVFLGSLVGGVAGALIADGTSHKNILVTSIPYISKPKKQPEATCIDMITGALSF